MQITTRILQRRYAATGQNPDTTLDTDLLSPPVFADVVAAVRKSIVIVPADTTTTLAIPDCCSFTLTSDQPVKFRWSSGEKLLTTRRIHVDGEDEGAVAVPSSTLVLNGNTVSTAHVEIVYYETVT
jgi:hypothetical protein